MSRMLCRFRHLPIRSLRIATLLALAAIVRSSPAAAAPWQRGQLLGSPLNVNVRHADLRFLDSSAADLRIWNDRILLRAPGVEPAALEAVAAAIESRLHGALDSWAVTFSKDDPIRMLIFSSSEPP